MNENSVVSPNGIWHLNILRLAALLYGDLKKYIMQHTVILKRHWGIFLFILATFEGCIMNDVINNGSALTLTLTFATFHAYCFFLPRRCRLQWL